MKRDINIRVAVAGNVDSGKTTFTGLLINDCLDDGRGHCRSLILRTPHEKATGRTSTISHNNYIINGEDQRKIISLIDLAGHERYLKTTMFGITGCFVDYGLLMIGSNMGITKMTKEHLGIFLYMKLPIIILLTKIDICPDNVYENVQKRIRAIFKLPIVKKKPYFFPRDPEKCKIEMEKFLKIGNPLDSFVPIITISNKTGVNIEPTKSLMLSLPPKFTWKNEIDGTIMYIDSKFMVTGIGLVLSGTVRGKSLKVGQKLWIGPINDKFLPFKARSLHNNVRESVDEVFSGQNGCIAIKMLDKQIITRKMIKKGVIIMDNEELKKNLSNHFKAKITVLNHATTIGNNYSPVIHCGLIRQSAKIKILKVIRGVGKNKQIQNAKESDDVLKLRTGCEAIVEFVFKFRPEYIEKDFDLFFRDGTTKGFGKVIGILPPVKVEKVKKKRYRQRKNNRNNDSLPEKNQK